MKKSDIYQFYFFGVNDQIKRLLENGSIRYEREKHRYIISNLQAYSDVMRFGMGRISAELKDELKVARPGGDAYEWLFRLMTDVDANSLLSRILLTQFSPYMNSPMMLYYLALIIEKYETCDADSKIFNSPKVRFNNIAKLLNSLVDHALTPEELSCLSKMYSAQYLFDLIPSRQRLLKSAPKGELFWLFEKKSVKMEQGYKSNFLQSKCFKPWANEAITTIDKNVDRYEFQLRINNLIVDAFEQLAIDGRFDFWDVSIVPLALQHYVVAAVNERQDFREASVIVRCKQVDVSPLQEAEINFYNRAKGIFGI